jgi:hypothetical protein
MTSNQLKYWDLQEQKRTNRANEDLKSADISSKASSERYKADKRLQGTRETNRSKEKIEGAKMAVGAVKDTLGMGVGVLGKLL